MHDETDSLKRKPTCVKNTLKMQSDDYNRRISYIENGIAALKDGINDNAFGDNITGRNHESMVKMANLLHERSSETTSGCCHIAGYLANNETESILYSRYNGKS